MPSAVDICNQALDLIGTGSITSLLDDTLEARICNRNYKIAVRQVQRLFPWRSLRTRTSLPADVDTPAFGFDHQYTLPADFLRFIEMFESDGETKVRTYQIESDKILTDADAPISIIYLRKSDNPNEWDELLQSAIAYRLATMIVGRIVVGNDALRKLAWQEYEQVLGEAKRAHAHEMHPVIPDLQPHDWSLAHYKGY